MRKTLLRYNKKFKGNLKKIIAFVIIFAVLGIGAIFIINAIVDATKFMYIPGTYNNGDNAYDRGWKATSTDKPGLTFVNYGGYRGLKLQTMDENKIYSVAFNFDYSYFVRTEFSIVLEGEDASNIVLRALLLQYEDTVVTLPLTTFDMHDEYYFELNDTNVEIGMNDEKTYDQPIPAGGMNDLKFEVSGFNGAIIFVDLKGRRL